MQRAWQRYARKGTTAQRGYAGSHPRERERRLGIYRPGDICAHGGEPLMFWPPSVARRYLDLPHNADRSGYLPGLSCRRHNRGEGAARGNRRRRQRRAAKAAVTVTTATVIPRRSSRQW